MKHLILAVVAALALPDGLAAQQSCSDQVRMPTQGAWSEYDVQSPSGTTAITRLAVIGSEKAGGRDLAWVETRAANPAGEVQAITHVLVPSFPYAGGDLQAAVLQGTNGVAVRLTEAQVAWPDLTEEAFTAADTDGNGELSAEEYDALVAASAAPAAQ